MVRGRTNVQWSYLVIMMGLQQVGHMASTISFIFVIWHDHAQAYTDLTLELMLILSQLTSINSITTKRVCCDVTLHIMLTSWELGYLTSIYGFLSYSKSSLMTRLGMAVDQHTITIIGSALRFCAWITWSHGIDFITTF